jgi:hypothetical protein
MAGKRDDEVGSGTPLPVSPETIEIDIERTRADIGVTIAALETRLSPAHLKEQISSVKEHAVAELDDAKHKLKADIRETANALGGAATDLADRTMAAIRKRPMPVVVGGVATFAVFFGLRRAAAPRIEAPESEYAPFRRGAILVGSFALGAALALVWRGRTFEKWVRDAQGAERGRPRTADPRLSRMAW